MIRENSKERNVLNKYVYKSENGITSIFKCVILENRVEKSEYASS